MSSSATITLISGANSGVGLATAQRLAKEHGHHVIIGSRNAEAGAKIAAELQAEGHLASSIQLDLTSDTSVAAAAKFIEEKFGHLDVLINNAGILIDGREPNLRELYNKTFGTNVIGTAALTEAVIPLLRKSTHPCIVFVSSRMGSVELSTDKTTLWHNIDYKVYDASKAALNVLAINYSQLLEDVGARVNVICPGLVATNLGPGVENGTTPYVGAQRVVDMATIGKDGPTATFSSSDIAKIPW